MRRRIGLIAPPWYPVPPQGYGGIELVVGLLADELRRRGHDVTLFAAEGSAGAACTMAPREWTEDLGGPLERLRELAYAARVSQRLGDQAPFDVVHDHCGNATLLGATLVAGCPVVHTVHCAIGEAERTYYASLPPHAHTVAISDAQRATAPSLAWLDTVYNAIDASALEIAGAAAKEPYLLCLARVCEDKGQHVAIEVARRAGMRLMLAGKVEPSPEGRAYFRERIEPHLATDRVVHIHNVAGAEKARLLARATALLAPLRWEEPFGLALVEAMASGTPVIAFPRGAAPELVRDGETGFLVAGADDMLAAVQRVRDVDPLRCAVATRERFSPAAMASGYLDAYERAIAAAEPDRDALESAAVLHGEHSQVRLQVPNLAGASAG